LRILVSNDDGVHSRGLEALVEEVKTLGHVTVVAPDRERSAVGHSLTFFQPLRVRKLREDASSVVYQSDGTPSDCILLGIYDLMTEKPDLIISGINRGANLGDDITYSGTVSAAMEGLIHGFPSFAISQTAYETMHWKTAAVVARRIAAALGTHRLPPKTFLNVNVPNVPLDELAGMEATVQGESIYEQRLIKRQDPRGMEYYWITGAIPRGEPLEGTDFGAVFANKVSITPVGLNLTNRDFLTELSGWRFDP
jgi:5'-nucleotidase